MKVKQAETNKTIRFVKKSEGISPMSLHHHDIF